MMSLDKGKPEFLKLENNNMVFNSDWRPRENAVSFFMHCTAPERRVGAEEKDTRVSLDRELA